MKLQIARGMVLALVMSVPLFADDKAKGAEEMSPQAAMAAAAAAAEPVREHAMLQRMEGTWDVLGKAFMPEAEPIEVSGTMVNEMVLGGRYLESSYLGTFFGQKFWGRGLEGYDRNTETHYSHWYDSMSTGVMILTGSADKTGKVRTLEGDRFDAALGRTVREKAITRIKSHSTYTYESWTDFGDGEWFRTMQLVFSKRDDAVKNKKGTR